MPSRMQPQTGFAWLPGKQLVLGIGCGRTGSASLAHALNRQRDLAASHEFCFFCAEGHPTPRFRPPLPWSRDASVAAAALADIARYPAPTVGDVASYWLPYLPWVLEHVPDVRVICITRDRDEVVRSFLHKTRGRNHWLRHDGSTWALDPLWDPVFPKYDVGDKETALGLYWDDYYRECARLRGLYPRHFREWRIEALNDPRQVTEILRFAGVEEGSQIAGTLRLNRGRMPLLRRILRRRRRATDALHARLTAAIRDRW